MIYKKKINQEISLRELVYQVKDQAYPFLLESRVNDEKQGRYSYFSYDPLIRVSMRNEITAIYHRDHGDEQFLRENPLYVLKQIMKEYQVDSQEDGFVGGLVGFFSYDYLEENLRIPLKAGIDRYDDMFFGLYLEVLRYDHLTGEAHIFYHEKGQPEKIEALLGRVDVPDDGPYQVGELKKVMTKEAYEKAFQETIHQIEEGNVYEINLTQNFQIPTSRAGFYIYDQLRKKNKADFMAYMDFGHYKILSSSPERFFRLTDEIEVRPIKGTIRRSSDPVEDQALQQELLSSEKDISELLMIVDLMRNDLSLVCQEDSVKTQKLFELESYENVHHLVATIVGKLREDKDVFDFIEEAFPGGSITGAPKRAAIQVIDQVENYRRGPYTGSLGYFSLNGQADFNILIRTIILQEGVAHFAAGGAVTWDSTVEGEYQESLEKARKLRESLE